MEQVLAQMEWVLAQMAQDLALKIGMEQHLAPME